MAIFSRRNFILSGLATIPVIATQLNKNIVSSAHAEENKLSQEEKRKIIIENIMNRTSVRVYQKTKIDNAILDDLVKIGMSAPSAGNRQPWEFIVITDEKLLIELSKINPAYLKNAPAAILTMANLDVYNGDAEYYKPFWIQDLSAATENILLAAEAYELGGVWTGLYPVKDYSARAQKVLNLPENLIPMNIIVLGYPKLAPKVKDKWKPEKVHYNTYKKG